MDTKNQILVTGSCVVDLIFLGKILAKRKKKGRLSLALGGKYTVEKFFQFFGGGGANAAISLARQGFPVKLWARAGKDFFGEQILRNLKKEGVNTALIDKTTPSSAISAILLTEEGEKTIVTYRGEIDRLKYSSKITQEIKNSSWLVVFSLANLPKEEKLQFLKQAKKVDTKIFLSLHAKEYRKGLAYLKEYLSLDPVIHMNAHELADIFDKEAANFAFHKINFAKKLGLSLLVVSYDVHGSFAYTPEKIYYQPIFKVKPIDTTGAGDAFASGFLGEYIKLGNIQKALAFAARNAAAVIREPGAQNGLLYRT